MATKKFMIDRGQAAVTITTAVGLPTVSKNIELTVDMGVGLKKGDVMKALGYITDYIKKSDF